MSELNYEMYRLQLLNGIINQYNTILNCDKHKLDSINSDIDIKNLWTQYKSFAFALTYRIYPFFENINKDVFKSFSDSVYDIPYFELLEIYEYLDQQETKFHQDKDNFPPLSFYQIESELGGKGQRFTIINALQYAKLKRRFLWVYEKTNLNYEDGAPIEAHILIDDKDSDFKIDDIRFL